MNYQPSCLQVGRTAQGVCPRVGGGGDSFRALFNADYWGAVDGLHDSGQATAQVVGLVDMDFGRVFKNYRLSRTVQNPRQKLTQLHLQWVWKQSFVWHFSLMFVSVSTSA